MSDGEDVALVVEPDDIGPAVEGSVDVRLFTLNCYGLRFVSAKRKRRMEAIGDFLLRANYDVVVMQEVWLAEDFALLRDAVAPSLPHSHCFDHGIIGSGTCVFSRVRLASAAYHEFGLNGYPHKFWHGDWFSGKGLGVCHISVGGFNIHVFTSHFHAEYDRRRDVYLGHRVLHALESSQWIKLTSGSADLTLYAGDFNSEPIDVPYKLLRAITPLSDSWVDANGPGGGETHATPTNSFTRPRDLETHPHGKRIDYVLYQAGPQILASVVSCKLPLPPRVPQQQFSYSDHEGIATTFRLSRKSVAAAPLSTQRSECICAVSEAIEIVRKSRCVVKTDKIDYALLAGFFLVLLVVTFAPTVLVPNNYVVAAEVVIFLPRFFITIGLVYFMLMATLFNKMEQNALRSTESSLKLILDQDKCDDLTGLAREVVGILDVVASRS